MFIIVLVLLIFVYYYSIRSIHYEKMNINDLKTGDLLLFRSKPVYIRFLYSFFQRFFTNSLFTHVGMVYKENGIIYVIESHEINKYHKSGVQVYPLKNRFKTYSGNIYVRKLQKSINNIQKEKLKIMVNHFRKNDIKFPYNLVYNYVSRCILKRKGDNQLNCSELIGFLYNVLGIFNFKNLGCVTPWHFEHINGFQQIKQLK